MAGGMEFSDTHTPRSPQSSLARELGKRLNERCSTAWSPWVSCFGRLIFFGTSGAQFCELGFKLRVDCEWARFLGALVRHLAYKPRAELEAQASSKNLGNWGSTPRAETRTRCATWHVPRMVRSEEIKGQKRKCTICKNGATCRNIKSAIDAAWSAAKNEKYQKNSGAATSDEV